MKKVFVLIVALILMMSGCTVRNSETISKNGDKREEFTSGVWFSFSEINSMLKSTDGFKVEFERAINNCVDMHFNEVYIHVRAYCDSLYPSDYFPIIDDAKNYDYDVFKYIIDICHSHNIKVHAWINPYRVLSSSQDIDKLDKDSPAYKWLRDDNVENDINVCFSNGIYLNPAEYDVRQLVISGIREIVTKYNVDGVHFDDYFYPTTDESFDKASYDKYLQTCKSPLSLDNWRRANVNALVSGCYTAIKFINKDIEFSISPMASIENNYNNLYADVKTWIENGCIDCIIPQLYFGFKYSDSNFQFENLLQQWQQVADSNNKVKIKIGLATYKIGTDSAADKEEWNNDTDIIARQVEKCNSNESIDGFVCFSYTSLFSNETLNSQQRSNLANIIKALELT